MINTDTMLSKNEIKDIQSLSLKKKREEAGLFIAEGPKVVQELMTAIPEKVKKIYATREWIQKQAIKNLNLDIQPVTAEELNRLSNLPTPNGVVAIFQQWKTERPVLKDEISLYLDAIQDPGNLGTIIRTGDWFGIKNIICSEGCAEVFSPKVVQSTMGSITRVHVWYDRDGAWLFEQKVPIIATTLTGQSVYHFPKPDKGVLLLGNESYGVRKEFLTAATSQVTIPKKGGAESLNVAVATGILLSCLTVT